mmetsp:Transcript_57726/g.185524  ORF Transcript_57726/g.185524 Transcript_57726/m.185524 type:complete len:527 (-) Transcript_57726:235-1815(-)
MVVVECSCGFACGTEAAFRRHQQRFLGSPAHRRVVHHGLASVDAAHALRQGPVQQPGRAHGGFAAPMGLSGSCGFAAPGGLSVPGGPSVAGGLSGHGGLSAQGGHAGTGSLAGGFAGTSGFAGSGGFAGAGGFAGGGGLAGNGGLAAAGSFGGAGGLASGSSFAAGSSSNAAGGFAAGGPGALGPLLDTSSARSVSQRFSAASQEAMDALHRSDAELEGLEIQAEEVVRELRNRLITPGQARNTLVQLEARARSLETDGVDGIYTSELLSGRAHARAEKRGQLARLERFFHRLEVLFKWVQDVEASLGRYAGPAAQNQPAAALGGAAGGAPAPQWVGSRGAGALQSEAGWPSTQPQMPQQWPPQQPHQPQQPQQQPCWCPASGPAAGGQAPQERRPHSMPATSVRRQERPRAHRAYSLQSQEAIDSLLRCETELGGLEATTEDLARQLEGGALSLGQVRTALAQVESQAHRLETNGVDGIYTSDLVSGKAQAKSEKKEQLARLERLFSRLEGLFQQIGAAERGAAG